MCGIAGICAADGLTGAEREAVTQMVDVLRHRGPDGRGVHVEERCGLGHARLAIIDPAGGRQPMSNEAGTVWLVCNGQVYNYRALRGELMGRGHAFRTACDSEVIVHLYEELGVGCVERLNGMFALAVWDAGRGELLLARDRVGIKPLYWHWDGRRLVFGSELKAVLAAPGVAREVDAEGLADYLAYTYVPAPKTIFRGVRKLLPGHVLVMRDGVVRVRRYWDVPVEPAPERSQRDGRRIAEGFAGHLRQAVTDRLMSDVPLGAFLSGGVDSSAVVALMAEAGGRVLTHCVGFGADGYDELRHAEAVARQVGADHRGAVVRPDPAEDLWRLAWHYDEPFGDSSALPSYHLARLARERVTVCLSGDGADETLAGYRRYRFAVAEEGIRRAVPGWVRRGVVGPAARMYPAWAGLPRFLRGRATLRNLAADLAYGHYLSVTPVDPEVSLGLLRGDVRGGLGEYDPSVVVKGYFEKTGHLDPLSRCLYADIKTYLPDDILCKVDRASMAHGLEVRTPFLDHRLVEFEAGVPAEWKLRRGCGKYLLKRLVSARLGRAVAHRPKHGFEVPLAEWLGGPLREWARFACASRGARVREWLDPGALRRTWEVFRAGGSELGPLVWSVVMLELWAQRWLGGATQSQPPVRVGARELVAV